MAAEKTSVVREAPVAEKSSAKKFIPKGAPSVDASGADTSGADTVASTNLEPLFRYNGLPVHGLDSLMPSTIDYIVPTCSDFGACNIYLFATTTALQHTAMLIAYVVDAAYIAIKIMLSVVVLYLVLRFKSKRSRITVMVRLHGIQNYLTTMVILSTLIGMTEAGVCINTDGTQSNHQVTKVVITNRACGSYCALKLVGAKVVVGDSQNAYASTNQQCGTTITSTSNGATHTFLCDFPGQFVYVLLEGTKNVIDIAEVEVYVAGVLFDGGVASQSSSHSSGNFPASKARDGDKSSSAHGSNTGFVGGADQGGTTNPWWRLSIQGCKCGGIFTCDSSTGMYCSSEYTQLELGKRTTGGDGYARKGGTGPVQKGSISASWEIADVDTVEEAKNMCNSIPTCLSFSIGPAGVGTCLYFGSTSTIETFTATSHWTFKYTYYVKNKCSNRPQTTCAVTIALTPNTAGTDCKCGTTDCTSTTGMYCAASRSACYTSALPLPPEKIDLRVDGTNLQVTINPPTLSNVDIKDYELTWDVNGELFQFPTYTNVNRAPIKTAWKLSTGASQSSDNVYTLQACYQKAIDAGAVYFSYRNEGGYWCVWGSLSSFNVGTVVNHYHTYKVTLYGDVSTGQPTRSSANSSPSSKAVDGKFSLS